MIIFDGDGEAISFNDDGSPDSRQTGGTNIGSYAAYAGFSKRLRRCGFMEDTAKGAPICRWRQKESILDLMPLDEKIRAAAEDVRAYIAAEIRKLLATGEFLDALPGLPAPRPSKLGLRLHIA